MQLRTLDLKSFFFILILIILGWVMIQVVSPFISIIIIALVILQLFEPLHKWIEKKVKYKTLASFLTTLIVIVVVVIPLILILLLIINELAVLFGKPGELAQGLEAFQPFFNSVIDQINGLLSSLEIDFHVAYPDFEQIMTDIINTFRSKLAEGNGLEAFQGTQQIFEGLLSFATNVVTSSIGAMLKLLFDLFIFFITLVYLFNSYDKLPKVFSRISPLDDELDTLLINKFTDTSKAVIIGNFIVAIAQATSVSVMMLILGIGSPALLWVLMVLLSLIPVGSGLIWAPIGLVMIINGNILQGALLIVYSAIIINLVDTLLRPNLLKGRIQLHPLVIMFSVLGGLFTFGPLGILYGPLIAVFFTSLMDVYTERYSKRKKSNTKLH